MTALDNIKQAVALVPADAPPTALVGVIAGESAAVAQLVKDHDEVTAALLKGALAFPTSATVYQQACDLRHLLAKVAA